MRVGQISVYSQVPVKTLKVKRKEASPIIEQPPNGPISFQGRFGAWIGGIAGGAAVVVAALAAAPAAVCLLGGGAIIGALGGDAAEDYVNKKSCDDN